MSETSGSVRLLNATGKPVHVRIGERLVLLPEVPEPVLLQFHSDKNATVLPVVVEGLESAGSADVRLFPSVKEIGVLHCPAREPGVMFLVDPDVVLQFPDREDFVTPALWAGPVGKERKASKGKRQLALVGVTRTPYAKTGPKTQMLTDLDMPSLYVEAVQAAGAKVPKKVAKEVKRRG